MWLCPCSEMHVLSGPGQSSLFELLSGTAWMVSDYLLTRTPRSLSVTVVSNTVPPMHGILILGVAGVEGHPPLLCPVHQHVQAVLEPSAVIRWHYHLAQLGVIRKFLQNVYLGRQLIYVVDENIKQYWSQHTALRDTGLNRCFSDGSPFSTTLCVLSVSQHTSAFLLNLVVKGPFHSNLFSFPIPYNIIKIRFSMENQQY